MKTYLDALAQVLQEGTVHEDRTGTGTISLFGMHAQNNPTRRRHS